MKFVFEKFSPLIGQIFLFYSLEKQKWSTTTPLGYTSNPFDNSFAPQSMQQLSSLILTHLLFKLFSYYLKSFN